MNIDKIMMKRTTSGFDLSIGTALAMESLFMPTMTVYDENREVKKINTKEYEYHFISVYLLVRNIITSFDTMTKSELMSDPNRSKIVFAILEKELEVLDELYSTIDMKPVLWIPSYKELDKNIIKKDYTGSLSKKDEIFLFTSEVVSYLETAIKKKTIPLNIYENKHLLPKLATKNLVSTYIPTDLLNINRINKLDLLESHTGKLMDKKEFNKKYHPIGKADMSRLPFLEYLLYILGDTIFIRPENIKIRKEILTMAEVKRWNPTTPDGVVKNALLTMSSIQDRVRSFKRLY